MKVIMTASRCNLSAIENAERNAALLNTVSTALGITGQPVTGFWQGDREASFIFHGVTFDGLALLESLAVDYKQDAILVVRDDNRAILYSHNYMWSEWEADDVGDWQQVSAAVARQFDGYTLTADRRYFVACTRAQRHNAERNALALTSLSECEARAYGHMAVSV